MKIISPVQLKELIDSSNNDFQLIDIRDEYEFDICCIGGEKINMYSIELVEYAHYNIINGIICAAVELGHLWPQSFYDERGIIH